MAEGVYEGTSEGAAKIDGELEGELDVFKEVDSLGVLEGSNEPIDILLDIARFTDGNLLLTLKECWKPLR